MRFSTYYLFCFFSLSLIPALALEVTLSTGAIKKPSGNGSFSGTSIGNAATVFLCLTDANTYNTYAADSRSLYDAWKDGAFNGEEYRYEGTTAESGIREATFEPWVEEEEAIYYISIAEYISPDYGRTYYIATTGESTVLDASPFAVHSIANTITGVGTWSYIPEPMTEVRWPIDEILIASSTGAVSLSWNLPTEGMTLAGDDLLFRVEGGTTVNGPWTQCGKDVAVPRNAAKGSANIETAGTPFATAGCGFFRLWWTNKAGQ